jgi:type VI secretion system protein ImpK
LFLLGQANNTGTACHDLGSRRRQVSDNPFSQPEDNDRTVIRPAVSRRPASPLSDRTSERPELSPAYERDGDVVEPRSIGSSPLVAAAAPLLQLLARLSNTSQPPQAGDLRERTAQALRAFEQRARADGIPLEQLRPAHYALCASLDDVVLNTPWGSRSGWDARSLVSAFHQEVRGGERFFDLLRQMKQEPAKFLPVVELMYLCMSLGFIGRYRVSQRGTAELDSLREDTYAVLARYRTPVELARRVRPLPAIAHPGAALGWRKHRRGRRRRLLRMELCRAEHQLGPGV